MKKLESSLFVQIIGLMVLPVVLDALAVAYCGFVGKMLAIFLIPLCWVVAVFILTASAEKRMNQILQKIQ